MQSGSLEETPPTGSAIAPDPVLGNIQAGKLQVVIATDTAAIAEGQRLRYDVFVNEMGAAATPERKAESKDFDEFDPLCDHLQVIEHLEGSKKPRVVGTYRLLRRAPMQKLGRFYSASEFDISAMLAHPGEILELGRSCVHRDYRNRAVMQLLWRGIGAYVERYRIEIMFGCASLPGTNTHEHAALLSYLHHYHLAPPELRLTSLPSHYVSMNLLPKESIDVKTCFVTLPALIKGYLRLGGYVGDGAVIDRDYNTIDVGIVVKSDLVTGKYVQRYGTQKDPNAF